MSVLETQWRDLCRLGSSLLVLAAKNSMLFSLLSLIKYWEDIQD